MPSNTAQCKQGGEQWQQGSGLAKDMEYNKVIKPKVIIWCNVQSGVVFRTHIDPNSGATGGTKFIWANGHKQLLQFWPYSIMGYYPVGFTT